VNSYKTASKGEWKGMPLHNSPRRDLIGAGMTLLQEDDIVTAGFYLLQILFQ